MKSLLVVLLAGSALSAQVVSGRAAGGVVFANPGGYGNVAFPGTGRPHTPVSGGTFGQPAPFHNGNRGFNRGGGLAFGYPVIVSGGFEGYTEQPGYAQQPNITIINNPPAQAAPAVIINQNFGPQAISDPGGEATTHIFQPTPRQELATTADSGSVPAPHYFLIAYKDHSVYSALAYWVEDKTMHYVTPQQTHNQASLDLIDMDFTKKLNQR